MSGWLTGRALARSAQVALRSSMREFVAAAAGMLALAVCITWPLALNVGRCLPGDLADPLFNAFVMSWDADRMAHGMLAIWDAPLFFPLRDTLAFSDHLLGIAVFTAPIQWLTGNAVLAYDLAFIASYALAGFGAYLLARSLWRSRVAGWVAGVAFLAAPHRVLQMSHLQILASGWLPLSLWGLHEYFARGSRRALAVSVASYLLLALSSSYLMYFGLLPIVLVTAAGLARQVRHRADAGSARGVGEDLPWQRSVRDLSVAAVSIALALAPVAIAYLRVRRSTGLRRSVGEMAMFSARWSDYLYTPDQLSFWGHVLPAGLPERMLFPGLLVVLLAATAVIVVLARRRRRGMWDADARLIGLYAVIFGLSLWFSLGPAVAGPYRWLAPVVPGLDGLRVPARFVVVTALALAILAGRGAAWAAGLARGRVVCGVLVSVVIATVVGLEGFAVPVPLASFDPWQRQRTALNAWLRGSPPGGVLELPVAGPAFQPFTTAYEFNTLLHGHPIVNGYSGTGYGLQDFLASSASPLARLVEVPAALEGLRSLGVRYLVLHSSSYQLWHKASARPLVDAVDAEAAQVVARTQFDDAIAWRLAGAEPWLPGPLLRRPPSVLRPSVPIDRRATTASASDASTEAGLAMDGSTATAWTTGRPKLGDEWFEVAFDRPRDVASVVFRSDRNVFSGRALSLSIDSIGDDGGSRTIFEGSIVPAIMAGLAGKSDGAVVPLPPNSTRALRLRQTGHGGTIPWSIEEMEVREGR